MNEEELNYLLRSENIEDVILGCRIAAEHLGEEWCKKHFRTEFNYKTGYGIGTLLTFDQFQIWIGPQWIQYYKEYPPPVEIGSIISFETAK